MAVFAIHVLESRLVEVFALLAKKHGQIARVTLAISNSPVRAFTLDGCTKSYNGFEELVYTVDMFQTSSTKKNAPNVTVNPIDILRKIPPPYV